MQKKKIFVYLVIGLLIFLFGLFLYFFKSKVIKIAIPFLWAIPIVYVVKPIADKLENKGIPRVAAILSVYVFIILAMVSVTVFFIPELTNNAKELMNTLPELTSSYQKIINNIIANLRSSKWSEDVKTVIFNEMQNGVYTIQSFAANMLKKSLTVLVDIIKMVFDITVAMVIAYYIIKDSSIFREFFLSLTPRRFRNGLIGLGKEINIILSGFIRGQFLTALIVGIMETIGLLLAGIKYPIILGMIGGIANIIPYFGPYIGAVPAVLIAFMQSPFKMMWAIAVFLVVQQIDNSYISPKIIEGKLGLHPVATLFAVLVGGEFMGVLGMLVAVPIVAILRVIVRKTIDSIAS